jgi:hypothetical protein
MTDTVNAAVKQTGEEGGEDETAINTARRRSLISSQKQAIIINYFSEQHQLCKKSVKQFVKFCECIQ